MKRSPLLSVCIVSSALLAAAPFAAGAQPASGPTQKERDARKSRAIENCKANRGVDCDTPQGLKEWELLERSRAEAIRDGSRRKPPEPSRGKQTQKQ